MKTLIAIKDIICLLIIAVSNHFMSDDASKKLVEDIYERTKKTTSK